MILSKIDFSNVIKNTPLISIDLIIENEKGQFLLGKRLNNPAINKWFVPGGRIFKDEPLDDAFRRTTKSEIGMNLERKDVTFYGLYEHFYENNVFDDTFSTHYIVLGHKFKINEDSVVLNSQHEVYAWFDKELLLKNDEVHPYTKDYFS